MTKFEELLIDKGYKRHSIVLNKNNKVEYVNPTTNYYSSMGNVSFMYINGDSKIQFGLNEAGKPPTLIYPRPTILKREGDAITAGYSNRDDYVNRLLQNEDLERIFDSLFNDKIIFWL